MSESNIYDIGYRVEEAVSSRGHLPYAMQWPLR